MRRPVLAVAAGLLVLLMAVATAAITLILVSHRGDAPGYRMSSMMSPRSDGQGGPGSGGGMHGAAVASEFDYLAEMVAHHEEAVTAAQELQRSERAQMREFGAAIVTTQSAQIQQMRTWLAEWYPGRSTDVDYQPMMRDLSGLSGDALDRAFLQDMTVHHMMAVMMSQQLLARGLAEHGEVSDLAVSIRDEQHAEIVQMRQWLGDWFDVGMRGGMGPWMTR